MRKAFAPSRAVVHANRRIQLRRRSHCLRRALQVLAQLPADPILPILEARQAKRPLARPIPARDGLHPASRPAVPGRARRFEKTQQTLYSARKGDFAAAGSSLSSMIGGGLLGSYGGYSASSRRYSCSGTHTPVR